LIVILAEIACQGDGNYAVPAVPAAHGELRSALPSQEVPGERAANSRPKI
jgi:hypothetical protein